MERLRRKHDIDRLFREGRRFHAPWVVLLARPRGPQEGLPPRPRLAVTTGRHFTNAVQRSRARRLLREACRVALGDVGGPWDLLLIARPEALSTTFADRIQTLAALLDQAGVLTEKAAAAV